MGTTILPTRNTDWGFFGTIRSECDPTEAFAKASESIAKATGGGPEGVRDFLDSRHGRHFADDVANGLFAGLRLEAAITAAIERWMGWRIGRRLSNETGIPHGLPYLTGLVTHHEILAEAEE